MSYNHKIMSPWFYIKKMVKHVFCPYKYVNFSF